MRWKKPNPTGFILEQMFSFGKGWKGQITAGWYGTKENQKNKNQKRSHGRAGWAFKYLAGGNDTNDSR